MKVKDLMFHCSGLEYIYFFNADDPESSVSLREYELTDQWSNAIATDWYFKVDALHCLVLVVNNWNWG